MSKRSLTNNEPFDAGERERAQERFRLVVEAAPSAMLMVNKEGTITLVNKQVEQLFGYNREELIGQRIELLVPERYRAVHPSHRHIFSKFPSSRAMSAGRGLCGRRKDGSETPIEIHLNPIETDEGSFVLASIIDITERKAAGTSLRDSEQRLNTVSEKLTEGHVIPRARCTE
jgi:PAS domain S-box-containing protein